MLHFYSQIFLMKLTYILLSILCCETEGLRMAEEKNSLNKNYLVHIQYHSTRTFFTSNILRINYKNLIKIPPQMPPESTICSQKSKKFWGGILRRWIIERRGMEVLSIPKTNNSNLTSTYCLFLVWIAPPCARLSIIHVCSMNIFPVHNIFRSFPDKRWCISSCVY